MTFVVAVALGLAVAVLLCGCVLLVVAFFVDDP